MQLAHVEFFGPNVACSLCKQEKGRERLVIECSWKRPQNELAFQG